MWVKVVYPVWTTVTLVSLLVASRFGVNELVVLVLACLHAFAIVGWVAPGHLARVFEALCELLRRR